MNKLKPIAVFYATREGHTHKIAERVADDLRKRGFAADVTNLRDKDAITLSDYAGAILAASVHAGTHEPEMVAFVKQHRAELESMPSAFLSVTLSEVGAERANATVEEHARFVADVQGMLNRFFEDTGWHPRRVKPVAGALLYTKYNFLIRFVMRRIAKKAGAETDTSRDYEYTDWVALDHFVEEVAEEISRSTTGPGE
jgi:menaquinone-dependent protoporphyrinogen oxidase